MAYPSSKGKKLGEWIGMEWVLDKSIFDFLVIDSSLFNCIGFSDNGVSVVGFSNIGQSNSGCGCSYGVLNGGHIAFTVPALLPGDISDLFKLPYRREDSVDIFLVDMRQAGKCVVPILRQRQCLRQ